jgi:hypothetical protein
MGYVDDNTSLPSGKVNKRPIPSGEESEHLSAAEFAAIVAAVDDLRSAVKGGGAGRVPVNAKDHGVLGNWNPTTQAGADDRDAMADAIVAAIVAKTDLRLPPGQYRFGKYVPILNCAKLAILGSAFSTIYFASDDDDVDAEVGDDAIATSKEMARCAFLLVNSAHVTIEGLTFRGGLSKNLDKNQGSVIYATRSVAPTMSNCHAYGGYSLFAQDTMPDSSGIVGDIEVADGVVTVNADTGTFHAGMPGRSMTIAGDGDQRNRGAFEVLTFISSSQVTIRNPNAVDELGVDAQWSVNDGDRAARILSCKSFLQRGFLRTASDSVIRDCYFERNEGTHDRAGVGGYFAISDTTVTFTYPPGGFRPSHTGKIFTPQGTTSPGNLGSFVVEYVGPTQIRYSNPSGVSEVLPSLNDAGKWWLANGEKAGFGAGVGSISKSGSIVTFIADRDMFGPDDVDGVLRFDGPSNAGNRNAFVITEVVSPTTAKFVNASGVNENYSGIVTYDSFDNAVSSLSQTHGSTHGIYIYAGRSGILIEGCTFRGIRTTCIKVSGSAAPISGITVRNNFAYECGEFVVAGADDAQEHSNMLFEGNYIEDCGTSTVGRTQGHAMSILGSKGTRVANNRYHYTRPAIGAVNGRGISGHVVLQCSRFVDGRSQPIVDLTVEGNQVTQRPGTCGTNLVASIGFQFNDVGIPTKWRTGGTLTKSGNTMTLADPSMTLSWQDHGKPIVLRDSASGNDVSTRITRIVNNSTLEYVNASGTGGGVSAGTYVILEHEGQRSSYCRVSRNSIADVAGISMQFASCVGPDVTDNTISNGIITFSGDDNPRVHGNRCTSMNTQTSMIRFGDGTSWPIEYDNTITNNGLGTSSGRDMSVGITSTPVDYPLRGVSGRAKPTQAFQEVVIPYGSKHIEGHTSITVGGNTFTYKASSPSSSQYNSKADLISKINALASYNCIEYGSDMSPAVNSGHLKITYSATSTADGILVVTTNPVTATAFPMLRNGGGANTTLNGRGSGTSSGGTVPDAVVVWSPLCGLHKTITLVAANAEAAELLAMGSKSTGVITCTTKANYADTDYMTIGDGIAPAKLYEFDTAGDGVTAGRVQVNISSDTTAATVAARLKTAIEANQPALTVVDNLDGTLTVTHKLGGAIGNATMSENVANAAHTVSGLSGGYPGGFREPKNSDDAGCCATMKLARTTSGAEFRWAIR